MKIAIDIDDVLANFTPALIEFHNTQYGTNYTLNHFNSYHLEEVWGGTREEAIDKVFIFYETPEFKNVDVIENAKNVLYELKQSHDLVTMTARPEAIRDKTEEWIGRHFPGLFSHIHIANRFSKTGPKTTKAELCEKHGVDMLIDDSLDYALQAVAPHRRVLLFDRPWNQTPNLPEGIHRVHSWKEIPKLIWNS